MGEVFFVRQARFAKVYLVVNHTWQQVFSASIDDLIGGCLGGSIQICDRCTVD